MSQVNAIVTSHLAATYTGAAGVGSASQVIGESKAVALTGGTGAGKADKLYSAAINIAASGNTTINLTTGDDVFGVALAMVKVKAIVVEADATNTNDIVIGNGTNPLVGPFGAGNQTIAVKPGGMLTIASKDGYSVVASTGDVVKITNSSSGSAVTGKIAIIGASA